MKKIQKVLIAEDFDTINISLIQTLKSLDIAQIDHSKYCDDALLKIKKSILDNEPYDLLISDLSFHTDNRKVEIKSGEELIEKVKALVPKIKVIAYSIEDKSFLIKNLFESYYINAFVHKGRNSLLEIKKAIAEIQEDKNYISPNLQHFLQNKLVHEIDIYDIELLKQLSKGIPQEKMDEKFRELGIIPNSKSTIEKRVGKLKDYFKANNTVHLIAIAKDLGIT